MRTSARNERNNAGSASVVVKPALAGLQLAFKLAETDVDALDARGVERVWREVGTFLLRAPDGQPGGDTGGVWVGSELPQVGSKRELSELQLAVGRLLHRVALRSSLSDHDLQFLTLGELALVPVVASTGQVLVKVASGSTRDRYLLALVLLLRHVGADRVRRCRCGRPYLKVGRRTSCPDRACRAERRAQYWQNWKKSPSGRRALGRVYNAHGWMLGARARKRTDLRRGSTN